MLVNLLCLAPKLIRFTRFVRFLTEPDMQLFGLVQTRKKEEIQNKFNLLRN